MPFDVGNGGLKLLDIIDENAPTPFALRGGERSAFAGVAGEGMEVLLCQLARGLGFEVARDRCDWAIVSFEHEVNVIMADAAGEAFVVRFLACEGEALGDSVSLGLIESHGWIFERLFGLTSQRDIVRIFGIVASVVNPGCRTEFPKLP
jgi:hypothetical protein